MRGLEKEEEEEGETGETGERGWGGEEAFVMDRLWDILFCLLVVNPGNTAGSKPVRPSIIPYDPSFLFFLRHQATG